MREWLRGGAPPCQGGGRGFESRLALLFLGSPVISGLPIFVCPCWANFNGRRSRICGAESEGRSFRLYVNVRPESGQNEWYLAQNEK